LVFWSEGVTEGSRAREIARSNNAGSTVMYA
jgi:hypothetical protein